MTSATAAGPAPITRSEEGSLLGRTMGFVALTAGFFALGAYLGRNAWGDGRSCGSPSPSRCCWG
jgi:hypothetical protein